MRAWIARQTNSDLRAGLCWPRSPQGSVRLLGWLALVAVAGIAVLLAGATALGALRLLMIDGPLVAGAQAVLIALSAAGIGAVLWALTNTAVTATERVITITRKG